MGEAMNRKPSFLHHRKMSRFCVVGLCSVECAILNCNELNMVYSVETLSNVVLNVLQLYFHNTAFLVIANAKSRRLI